MGPIVIAAVWAVASAREPHKPLMLVLLGVSAAMAVSMTVQALMPSRPRPLYTPGLTLQAPFGMDTTTMADWSSFPSDHAAMVFAMAFAVWRYHRMAGLVALAWSALAVCVPRMFMGLHYPSDLLGGALIGIGAVALLPRTPLLAWGERVLHWPLARYPAVLPSLMVITMYLFITMFGDLRRVGQLAKNFMALH
jgi:undecaprenyl-diphosphatase